MSMRKLLLVPTAALVGAAVVVLPALAAAPSEVKLEVNEGCYISSWSCWNPKGNPPSYVSPTTVAPFVVAQDGTISFEDNGKATDVIWEGAAPSCSSEVPESAPVKTDWKGTCTFSQAGEYRFKSENLFVGDGADYTKYEVIVEKPTGTTPSGGGAGSNPEGGSSTPSGSSISGSGSQTQGGGQSPASGPGKPLGSVFVGAASQAVKLAPTQHGQSVHGAVDVSQAGSGGTLEVQLLAARGALASAVHASHVRVGRLVRTSLHAGTVSFKVALDAKAKQALRSRGRLSLTVRIALSSPNGSPAALTRSVTLRG